MEEYRVIKVDSKGNEFDCGMYTDIYEAIPHNYKFNGFFYETPNTKQIYVATLVSRDGNGIVI